MEIVAPYQNLEKINDTIQKNAPRDGRTEGRMEGLTEGWTNYQKG